MSLKYKTLTYSEAAKNTLFFVTSNPLFKIVLVPIVILSISAANFGVYVLVVISEIDRYLTNDIKATTPFILMVRYMTTPFFHYVLVLINEIIVTFFITSVMRQSFIAFTREYILVNYDKYHSLGSGQIHAIIQRRLFAIEEFLKLIILNIFHDLVYICVAFHKMYTKIDQYAFLTNIFLFFIYIFIVWNIIKMRSFFRLKYNNAYNKVSNKAYEILVNYDVIKSYTNEKKELECLNEKLEIVQKKSIVFEILTSLVDFAQKNALVIPNGYVLYLAMSEVKAKIGSLTQDALKATKYMTDISDSRIVESKLDDEIKGVYIDTFKKSIIFTNVKLKIKDILICSNINLLIRKGEKIAIVGRNGSGKSTFINLLLRMRDYDGSIKIDDIEMKDISKTAQRNMISYIPQSSGINDGTILENLKYSNSSLSDEKIIEICNEYGTHEIFSSLPEGYATKVGEMGKYLSGGQKQRVSFLRGIIKNGEIFILDEYTSNLDGKSQNELIEYLFTNLKYKTSIVILHNQEYLKKFDRIFGFHEGSICVYENYEKYLNDKHLY